MSEDLEELARRYRDMLRQAVNLVRAMDAEGELSTRNMGVMNMIAEKPMRVGAIARYSGVRVPSATEQVIKLENAGLVERIADGSDARVVLVRLTGEGRDALAAANARRNKVMAGALRTLTVEERQGIADAIPAIAKLNAALTA